MQDQNLMEKIVSLCKRRGFVFPGSEIYGGLAGTFDYGPYGRFAVNAFLNDHLKSTGLRAKCFGKADPVLDAMIESQAGELDLAKRKQVLFNIVHYILGKAYWDFPISSISVRGERPELHNYYPPGLGYDMRYLAKVWLDPQ